MNELLLIKNNNNNNNNKCRVPSPYILSLMVVVLTLAVVSTPDAIKHNVPSVKPSLASDDRIHHKDLPPPGPAKKTKDLREARPAVPPLHPQSPLIIKDHQVFHSCPSTPLKYSWSIDIETELHSRFLEMSNGQRKATTTTIIIHSFIHPFIHSFIEKPLSRPST